MVQQYENEFSIGSKDGEILFYEDKSCKINFTVIDFRDSVLWIAVEKTVEKASDEERKLSKEQKFEFYRRLASYFKLHGFNSGICVDDFKEVIQEDMENIDCTRDILEL